MFKKKKKKNKNREEAVKNNKNLAAQRNDVPSTPVQDLVENLDDTDGFDENGFVDLQPIESDATLLGPRQKCKVLNVAKSFKYYFICHCLL
jgi:hypothetical protein